MELQQLLLYLTFGLLCLLICRAWITDYHTPSRTAARQAPGAGTGSPTRAPLVPDDREFRFGVGGVPERASGAVATETAGVDGERIRVTTDVVDVTLDTLGGTVVGVDLLDYAVAVDRPADPFTLLSDDPARYLVAQSGLRSTAGTPAPTHHEPMLPTGTAFALAESEDVLRVPLRWRSPSGVEVVKTFVLRRGRYEIDVEHSITNGSPTPYTVSQYRQLKRKPATRDERHPLVRTYTGGVVSTADDRYRKVDFGDMADGNLDVDATDGWVAMIQHYFASAWIPRPGERNTAYSRYLPDEDRYLIGLISAPVTVAPGTTVTLSTKGYVGPKLRDELSAAAPHLELTVDYGWLTIIAKPLFLLLRTIHSVIGNWGFSIIVLTCLVKAMFYRLSASSYRSMARMRRLQPKLAALEERHGDDRAALGRATMDLYRKEKVNPLGGCLPMLVQVPVFIALYWTLVESVELRHAPWVLWIEDLSIRDPFFVLPVIMAATMYFQQKMGSAPADPLQRQVMRFLPLIFGVFFAFFPAGLLLYWIASNSLSIAQQYYVTRHVPAGKSGGVPPSNGPG